MIYSEQFFADIQTDTTVDEWVVPTDGAVYVLRNITVVNWSGSVNGVQLVVQFGVKLYSNLLIPANGTDVLDTRVVLTPGWQLQLAVGPGEASIVGSGYRLV